ncbi:MAG: ClpXP protease specificity-enhancing factor [Rubrivivax sp.]|nr:ClpXP protease specificity-enhancing factor [Rubrivivax sp.]MDP3225143.1 ClpXP protease specificity-enhancing factor [Rubrivivax sp.]MDP3610743.1 ClpXP protease specificity-enhancing factor [Rubrivivax sp.]
MTTSSIGEGQGTSTRPYLLRALHDWCTDNGFTPYVAVHVAAGVQVPMEYVKNNEIVLNVSFEATSGLQLGNEFIEFKARFGGVTREIIVPVDHVVAIYARENGQGMAFPVPTGAPGAGAPGSEPPGPRGLRLASSEPAAGSEASGPVVPLPAAAIVEPPESPEPEPTGQPPAGGRPSLKRIK